MFHFVHITGHVLAALCVVGFIPYILGVPGDPGEPDNPTPYARGWTMGLVVVCAFPVAWIVIHAPLWIWGIFNRGAAQNYQNVADWLGVAALVVAIVRLTQAMWILSKS